MNSGYCFSLVKKLLLISNANRFFLIKYVSNQVQIFNTVSDVQCIAGGLMKMSVSLNALKMWFTLLPEMLRKTSMQLLFSLNVNNFCIDNRKETANNSMCIQTNYAILCQTHAIVVLLLFSDKTRKLIIWHRFFYLPP